MNKKALLTIGSFGAVLMPIASVVACGSKTNSTVPTGPRGVIEVATSSNNKKDEEKAEYINPRLLAQEGNTAANHATLFGRDYLNSHKKPGEDGHINDLARFQDSFKDYRQNRKNAMAQELYEVTTAEDDLAVSRAIIKRYIGAELADENHLVLGNLERKLIRKEDTELDSKQEDDHYYNQYQYWIDTSGKLHINGSNPVSIAHGWYEWLKKNGLGMVGWEANSINTEKYKTTLADHAKQSNGADEKVHTSPYEKHYYMNSATAGYSTPWWTAEKWMDWLSWSAIHGYDLMLDYVGHEAVGALLYKEMGFSDEQIKAYYTGPAYATWGRLGNLAGFDVNPYFKTWCFDQIKLQHQVLKMMKKMSIKPIVASFAGFVPKDINSLPGYENTVITKTHWTDYNEVPSYFLNPYSDDPRTEFSDNDLFKNLSKRYVELYEKEFGPQDFYLADSFEEMTIPDGVEKATFYEQVGEKLYAGIKEATKHHTKYKRTYSDEKKRGEFATTDGIHFIKPEDNDQVEADGGASWAFQGWMLGFQRNDWDYNALHHFIKFVPKNKVLLIDEAEDYNQTFWNNTANYKYFKPDSTNQNSGESFDGARWVYSTIPNMGGNTATTGKLDWYATSGLDALKTPKHGYLYAYGSAPEGIDNNPVTQELISDMGWRGQEIVFDNNASNDNEANVDIKEYLQNYSLNRYGFTWNEATTPWVGTEDKSASDSVRAAFHLKEYWKQRLETVNSYIDDHPIYYFQYGGWTTWGALSTDDYLRTLKEIGYATNFFQKTLNAQADAEAIVANTAGSKIEQGTAVQKTALLDAKRKMSPLLKDDLYRSTAQYLGIAIDRLMVDRPQDNTKSDFVQKVEEQKAKIDKLYVQLDRVLREHNTDRLERWLEWARSWGRDAQQKAYYEADAKRHLTVWYPSLSDYAAKTWAGLVGSYYKARIDWQFDDMIGRNHPGSDDEEMAKIGFSDRWIGNPLWTDNHPIEDARVKTTSFGNTSVADAINLMIDDKTIAPIVGQAPDAKAVIQSRGYYGDMKGVVTKIALSTAQLRQLNGGQLAIYGANTLGEKGVLPKIDSIKIKFGDSFKFISTGINVELANNGLLLINFNSNIWGSNAENYIRESNNGIEMQITWQSQGSVNFPSRFFFIRKDHKAEDLAEVKKNILNGAAGSVNTVEAPTALTNEALVH